MQELNSLFREENDTVEKSEKWKKREEISRRAEQKMAEESIRLREKQRKEWEERKSVSDLICF